MVWGRGRVLGPQCSRPASHLAVRACAKAQHAKVLQELATNGTGADHKVGLRHHRVHKGFAQAGNQPIVAGPHLREPAAATKAE